jgi:hypothetical protein
MLDSFKRSKAGRPSVSLWDAVLSLQYRSSDTSRPSMAVSRAWLPPMTSSNSKGTAFPPSRLTLFPRWGSRLRIGRGMEWPAAGAQPARPVSSVAPSDGFIAPRSEPALAGRRGTSSGGPRIGTSPPHRHLTENDGAPPTHGRGERDAAHSARAFRARPRSRGVAEGRSGPARAHDQYGDSMPAT